jgi:hypothetical protein
MNTYFPLEKQLAYETHVSKLDPVVDGFCGRYAYRRDASSMGAYPGRLLRKEGVLEFCFEVSLALGEQGQIYQEFFPEVPFALGSGASVQTGRIVHIVYGPYVLERVPFRDLQDHLAHYLGEAHRKLSRLTPEAVVKHGSRYDQDAPFGLEDCLTQAELEEMRKRFDRIVAA